MLATTLDLVATLLTAKLLRTGRAHHVHSLESYKIMLQDLKNWTCSPNRTHKYKERKQSPNWHHKRRQRWLPRVNCDGSAWYEVVVVLFDGVKIIMAT